ncbi:hypothetical protein quinque_001204 [Culex quinquefasciatus]
MNETISLDQLSLAFTCRTCLNTDSRQQLVPIFDGHPQPFDLLQQLQFLKLKIAPDDGLPASICSGCMERLASVDAFRTQCEKAQEVLDSYFAGLPNGGKEVEELQYTDVEQLEEPTGQDEDLHCSVCGKGYKRRVHLERHLLKHKSGDEIKVEPVAPATSYVCLKCGKRFMKVESLLQHKTDGKCVSAEQPECRFCSEQFSSEQELEAHLEQVHPKDRPHACPLCKKTFQSVSNRNTHLLLHNGEGSVKCNECEQSFRSKVYLRRHVKAVHTVSHHECDQCEATFTSTAKYEYHLKSHNPNKKYQCRDCPKSFLQQHHLINHERIHSGMKPFLCNVCGKGFMHEPSFKTHLKIHAGVRPHVCEICSKSFVQRATYVQHVAKHGNTRAFQCDHCGKDFVQRAALAAHLKTHNQTDQLEEPAKSKDDPQPKLEAPAKSAKSLNFTCQQCNRVFKLPSSLESHMKIHREERNHVCGECGNCFKRAEHLRVHINGVHLKRKPYSCEVCHKAFAQSGDRNVHMRRHNGDDRPHKCAYCDKSFGLAKALRSHVRLHTGERPFVCSLCKAGFISYSALAAHTLKHQEEELIRSELQT